MIPEKMSTALEAARRYVLAGVSVIPVKADGSKSPAYSGWPEFRSRLPTEAELSKWFDGSTLLGVGAVPGPASGNMVVLDFECKGGVSAYTEFMTRLPPNLGQELLKLPIVRTPSGGRHVWVRLPETVCGGKLARYVNGNTKAEVRGHGHMVLAPGCPADCHRLGEYVFENQGWMNGELHTTTMGTWFELVELACSINEYAAPDNRTQSPTGRGTPAGEDAPGTDFNRRGSWAETGLFEDGWTWTRKPVNDERGLITRPGKSEGTSASIGMVSSQKNGWPLFYCWSTSVPEFVAEQPYTRFAVFAALKFQSDFTAAAKDLHARGYGGQTPEVILTRPEGGGPPNEADRMFRWMSELKTRVENDKWIWNGFISRGGITLLSALWKSGKSTLLSHLVRAFDGRDSHFLGREITPSRVLYVTEEHEELWAERRDDLGIGDHVGIICRPFKGRPSPADWVTFIGKLVETVQVHRFDMVVMDTISKLWPVREENDAGQVEDALMPVWALTNMGTALTLVHHTRKSGGEQFTGARGSGGLPAFCETLMEFSRESDDSRNRRRMLKSAGRYKETPPKWLVELTPAGYVSLGDPDDPATRALLKSDRWEDSLSDVLTTEGPGRTVDEIHDRLKDATGKSIRNQDLITVLNARHEGGEYVRNGRGVKADPFRYFLVSFPSDTGSALGDTHSGTASGMESGD